MKKKSNKKTKIEYKEKICNKGSNVKEEKGTRWQLFKSIKSSLISIKKDPYGYLKSFIRVVKKYGRENLMFCIFLFLNVFNAFLLRFLTIGQPFIVSPILADMAFVILIGSFCYLLKPKARNIYMFIVTILLSVICIINSAYYTFYTSFSSVSLLSTARFITEVGDAVVENVLQPKDITYIFAPLFLISFYFYLKTLNKLIDMKNGRFMFIKTITAGGIILLLFMATLTSLDVGRFTKQWNREYIVSKFGIYIYHVNDLVKSIEPKLTTLFGYDRALKTFNEYYVVEKEPSKNEYTGIFAGKNLLVIHAESIQNFVIGLEFNGVEVTPNLNKLAKNSLYFDNYYSQVSVGTSSDTEFTFNTSLMPSQTGTVFGSYFDRTFVSTPKLLKEKGYYTFAMHGNNADYWNRRIMHKKLGYDHLYGKSEYNIDEVIGLGLSDVSFFNQSVEKIKKIASENEKYYGTIITLTNHTPFSETDKYGEFDVSLKENITDIITNQEKEAVYPYMEDTKLGNYLKSVHYADYALGKFLEEMDVQGLLENTVVVLYGDHDARLPMADYVRLYNYDKFTDGVLDPEDPNYIDFNDYSYELNRKVPFIIWSKDIEKNPKKISTVMGMYDAMPTLGNMFGFFNKYELGNDIFSLKDNDNIVIFPTGNWLTNKVYYNNQKVEYYVLNNSVFSEDYIRKNSEYTDKALSVSNSIIVFDLIKHVQQSTVNEEQIIKGVGSNK